MPVIFDFVNTGAGSIQGPVTPLSIVTNTDTDEGGGTQSVKFTVSSDVAGGTGGVIFANTGILGMTLDDFGSGGVTENDVWTLRFEDTANPNFTKLTGTNAAQIAVLFGPVSPTGASMRMELLSGTSVVESTTVGFGNASGPVSFSAPSINAIRFTTLSGDRDRFILNGLTGKALNCFLEGTAIETASGPVLVEHLSVEDTVLTADGRRVDVRWLGKQFVDTRITHPAKVNPVCISAGALAEGVPERDLYVSPDHAIGIDGYLVSAGALVNGKSIYQVRNMPLDGFTYYHIETEAHELLLAEGCPAESFLDYSDTFGFDNADERTERVIPEMDLPRISSARHVPQMVRERLRVRAERMRPVAIAS